MYEGAFISFINDVYLSSTATSTTYRRRFPRHCSPACEFALPFPTETYHRSWADKSKYPPSCVLFDSDLWPLLAGAWEPCCRSGCSSTPDRVSRDLSHHLIVVLEHWHLLVGESHWLDRLHSTLILEQALLPHDTYLSTLKWSAKRRGNDRHPLRMPT